MKSPQSDLYMASNCYCGSHESYELCCQPYLEQSRFPKRPEALMRSRYTALMLHKPEYLYRTNFPSTRYDGMLDEITSWSKEVQFIALNVLGEEYREGERVGSVRFTALFVKGARLYAHHEHSHFERMQETWFYKSGEPSVEEITMKRNDLCPCGSGQKWKKCCSRKK